MFYFQQTSHIGKALKPFSSIRLVNILSGLGALALLALTLFTSSLKSGECIKSNNCTDPRPRC